jgi:hypothetical protein
VRVEGFAEVHGGVILEEGAQENKRNRLGFLVLFADLPTTHTASINYHHNGLNPIQLCGMQADLQAQGVAQLVWCPSH